MGTRKCVTKVLCLFFAICLAFGLAPSTLYAQPTSDNTNRATQSFAADNPGDSAAITDVDDDAYETSVDEDGDDILDDDGLSTADESDDQALEGEVDVDNTLDAELVDEADEHSQDDTEDEILPLRADLVSCRNYQELRDAIQAASGETEILLDANLETTTDHITLPEDATITLDLNGYSLAADDMGGAALFTIGQGATLTITDSQMTEATRDGGAAVSAPDAGALASIAGGIDTGITLTYYVTESSVTNALTGNTQETRYEYTVRSSGMICTTGQDHALFAVTGGTLNIESGFVYGESVSSGNRAIDASAGTVNLSGGYICGFSESYSNGHSEAYDGGAVRITDGAVLNISESAVLAANKAATGGAVDVADGGTLNMSGGVISGNEATEDVGTSEWANDYGGGGIHAYGSGTVVNISGGYLTNNASDCTAYFDGGGGILLNGATFNFSGGYITGNYAASSGGGIRTAFAANTYQMSSSVFITGGYLCANYAGSAEGGGLCLDNGSYSEIVANTTTIYINNNETDTSVHWGGGGVFCANGATMYMENTLITENAAGGFGGGVAGCSTGRIAVSDDAGAAIFNNSAQGEHTSGSASEKHDDTDYALKDKTFLENGYQDYYCALESMVSGMMLGGGAANWHGSADGQVVDEVGVDEFLWATYIMGLTAHPSAEAISAAQSAAKIYITGNSSYTHGGGVLSNGYLFMGAVRNYAVGDALQIDANKTLENMDGETEQVKEEEFSFEITDELGEVVSTGTTLSDGSIFFDKRLAFNTSGTFTYFIKETIPAELFVVKDTTVYTLVVTVGQTDASVEVDGSPLDFTYYTITHVTLTKGDDVDPLIDQDVTSAIDAVASITIPSPAFVNYAMDKTSITVHKIWLDEVGNETIWPDDIAEITVNLYQNGELYSDAITLSASNASYTWVDLPACWMDEEGEIYSCSYEVKEVQVSGYITSYEDQIASTDDDTDDADVVITNKYTGGDDNPGPKERHDEGTPNSPDDQTDTTSGQTDTTSAQTGDTLPIALLIGIALVAAVGVVVTAIKLYRSRA